MKKCWANVLGGCDTMSGEHVFSNVIFKAGCGCPPLIRGVERIQGGKPTAYAEKSNILCKHHNSMLSPLDELIGKVSQFQANANDENFCETLYLEGELLERWLLKTVVNNAAAGWMGKTKLLPAPEIVSAIFGHTPLPDGVGLYSVDGLDPLHRPSGSASALPVFADRERQILVGCYVSVHGRPLFAAFEPELAARMEEVDLPFNQHFSSSGLKHLYHPGALRMTRHRGETLFIGLSWKGVLRFADGSTAPFPFPEA